MAAGGSPPAQWNGLPEPSTTYGHNYLTQLADGHKGLQRCLEPGLALSETVTIYIRSQNTLVSHLQCESGGRGLEGHMHTKSLVPHVVAAVLVLSPNWDVPMGTTLHTGDDVWINMPQKLNMRARKGGSMALDTLRIQTLRDRLLSKKGP
ncbi:Hypothetical predicted protein [Pelobates cultripes]|uniref:Uncharacterized protein n=1 Tax=Pelobates cultripes TaxID=61616 RepID=A0AAD1S612_PELCU|nr:Hypothetical predicted protein [Pelobates cultripes]